MQHRESHESWVTDFLNYLAYGRFLQTPIVGVPNKPALQEPMRLIWFGSLAVFAPATLYGKVAGRVTSARVQAANDLSMSLMLDQSISGILAVDGMAMTQSMWESAGDGVHYNGAVMDMLSSALLSLSFGKCPSSPVPLDAPAPPLQKPVAQPGTGTSSTTLALAAK